MVWEHARRFLSGIRLGGLLRPVSAVRRSRRRIAIRSENPASHWTAIAESMESRVLLSSGSVNAPLDGPLPVDCCHPWLADGGDEQIGDEQIADGPPPDIPEDELLADDAWGSIPLSLATPGAGVDWDNVTRAATPPATGIDGLEGTPLLDADAALSESGIVVRPSESISVSDAGQLESSADSAAESAGIRSSTAGMGIIPSTPGHLLARQTATLSAAARGTLQGELSDFPKNSAESREVCASGGNCVGHPDGSRPGTGEPGAGAAGAGERGEGVLLATLPGAERERTMVQYTAGVSAAARDRFFQHTSGWDLSVREFNDGPTLPDQRGAIRGTSNDPRYTPDLVLGATLDLLTGVSTGLPGPHEICPLPGVRQSSPAEAFRQRVRKLFSAVDKPVFTAEEAVDDGVREGRSVATSCRTLQNSPGPATSEPRGCCRAAELDLTACNDDSPPPPATDHSVRSRLLHVIEARGPPQGERCLSPDIGSEAHSDRLKRLKFSISPRGPSLIPAFDAEFASVPSRSRR